MSLQSQHLPKNGAEVVVRTLEAHGVNYVFGIPGAKIVDYRDNHKLFEMVDENSLQ